MSECLKIILPQNELIIKALEDKLTEYRGRLEKINAQNPSISSNKIHQVTSSGYKAAITQRLLEKGELNTEEFFIELQNRDGPLNRANYDNAVFVIYDYCITGGNNICGGTGFPIGDKREIWEQERKNMNEHYSKKYL